MNRRGNWFEKWHQMKAFGFQRLALAVLSCSCFMIATSSYRALTLRLWFQLCELLPSCWAQTHSLLMQLIPSCTFQISSAQYIISFHSLPSTFATSRDSALNITIDASLWYCSHNNFECAADPSFASQFAQFRSTRDHFMFSSKFFFHSAHCESYRNFFNSFVDFRRSSRAW